MTNFEDSIAPVQREKARHVAGWLGRLARATRHQQRLSEGDLAAMLAEYTEILLRRDIPPRAYCLDGLAAVTERHDWWPPVGELARALEEFAVVQEVRNRNRADLLALPGAAGAPVKLSPSDDCWLRRWRAGEANGWAENDEKSVSQGVVVARRRTNLSMLKSYAPKVYALVSGQGGRA